MLRPPSVRLRGHFRYGDRYLFKDLDLELRAGRWTCLLGPSGVGKSTLLRLLCGLDSGGIFDGTMTANDQRPIVGRCAFLDQGASLAPWLTARENLAFGFRLRGETVDWEKISDGLARVGLSDDKDKTPRQLSGGMRQRLGLARTMLDALPIVLLDEPFVALDVRTRSAMHQLASRLLRNRTVLIVTHDPSEAAVLGDDIYILESSAFGAKGSSPFDLSGPEATERETAKLESVPTGRLCAPPRALNAPQTQTFQAALTQRLCREP